jgi:hypothetical protein
MNAANLASLSTVALIRRGRSIIARCLYVSKPALLRGLRRQVVNHGSNANSSRHAA